MTTLIAILAMAVPYSAPEAVPPCPKGKVMVGPRCKRHPRRHAGHTKGCFTYRCDRRMLNKRIHRLHRKWWRVVRPLNGYLNSIAQCESGRRWHIATGNGFYGGLQFTATSWWAVGGKGYAHQATELEQKYRAVLLSRIQGWGAWPNCH